MRAVGRVLTVTELIEELGTSHLPATAPVTVATDENSEPYDAVAVIAENGRLVIELVDPFAADREDLTALLAYVEDLSNNTTATGKPTAEAKRAKAVLDGLNLGDDSA